MTDDQAAEIANAIRSIARGGIHGPEGIEGLTMALMDGINGKPGVAEALNNVAASLDRIAEALEK